MPFMIAIHIEGAIMHIEKGTAVYSVGQKVECSICWISIRTVYEKAHLDLRLHEAYIKQLNRNPLP